MAAVFPLVFLGELPDKTMFASLVMASRGRPLAVWVGAAAAFAVHVLIAVSVGVALFHFLPRQVVDLIVAATFFGGAIYSFAIRNQGEKSTKDDAGSALRTVVTAAGVIFVAEWGDLTQIITANLVARYHSPVSVGLAALAALWVVAAMAVLSGSELLKTLSIHTLRVVTAAILAGFGVFSVVQAF